jgi:hypothetical protein
MVQRFIDEAVIFFELLALHADLFESHMNVDRLDVLGTGPSVCLDDRIDRVNRGCSRDARAKPGNATGGRSASGDGAED